MNTLWGEAQHQHEITTGVYDVNTAGHGGIMVHQDVAAQLLSPEALDRGARWRTWFCFEEDCDFALFAYEQPELYAAARTAQGNSALSVEETKLMAWKSLVCWNTSYLRVMELKERALLAQLKAKYAKLDAEGTSENPYGKGKNDGYTMLSVNPDKKHYLVIHAGYRITLDREQAAINLYEDIADHIISISK